MELNSESLHIWKDTEILLSRIEDPELRDYYNFTKIVIQTRITLKLLKERQGIALKKCATMDYMTICLKYSCHGLP